MKNENEYDFFLLGQKYANEGIAMLRKKAMEYEKEFGVQAKNDFELGVISTIPQYSNFTVELEENIRMEGATTNYGVNNYRNNSYFGKKGVGQQYVETYPNSGVLEYNDPIKKGKGK